jgi:hypothetical protein
VIILKSYESAVAGLMTALTGVILFAGNPDFSACNRIKSSLGAL